MDEEPPNQVFGGSFLDELMATRIAAHSADCHHGEQIINISTQVGRLNQPYFAFLPLAFPGTG
jgi:hypothetical protein